MLASKSPDVPLEKMIFVPSGDHRGPKQPRDVGSGIGPPQAGCACTEIWCSPVPLEWTTQIVLRAFGVTCLEKMISFPCGDQSPSELRCILVGVICFSPVPFVLTTKSASRDPRLNTSRLPSGDESPGMSSPPGVEVTRTRPPPSDERTV